MKSIDEEYDRLVELAEAQAQAIQDAIFEKNEQEDNLDDEDEIERLRGIARDEDGRAMLVFQADATPRQRKLVYVDAILDLARLLNRERVIEG